MVPPIVLSTTACLFLWAVSDSKVVSQLPHQPIRQARIDGLVEQLGHPYFRNREAASRELLSIGLDAKPALLKASQQSPDLEVRLRSERLLPKIDFNFCWDRASRILGETQAARRQFDEMYGTEKELWYALAEGNPDLGKKYAARCDELAAGPPKNRLNAATIYGDQFRYELQEGRLATLLVIGAECRNQIPKDSLVLVTRLFKQEWGGRYAKETPPVLRKSYVTWAEEIAQLPIEHEGNKQLELARAVLRSRNVSAYELQNALLTVAKAKDKQDDNLIRGFLSDETVCDTVFSKGVKTQVQMRDIALAATIYRAGKDPITFGFTNIKSDSKLLFRPSSLGFPGNDVRVKAFRAWNEAGGITHKRDASGE